MDNDLVVDLDLLEPEGAPEGRCMVWLYSRMSGFKLEAYNVEENEKKVVMCGGLGSCFDTLDTILDKMDGENLIHESISGRLFVGEGLSARIIFPAQGLIYTVSTCGFFDEDDIWNMRQFYNMTCLFLLHKHGARVRHRHDPNHNIFENRV